ncbi:cytidine deaminase [bacterium]|nr:cytidine deaminase [bacterium]
MLRMLMAARDARECAYAPYSNFKVGAAVLGEKSNNIYTGCNVENASYGLSMCAERVAIFKAVADGVRTIRAVAIIAGDGEIARPCGACLQVIAEFSPEDEPTVIAAANTDLEYDVWNLNDYLPMRFHLESREF